MNFINNLKLLIQLLKYSRYNFSLCKTYQILQIKKQKFKKEIIEFGSNNYEESLIKYNSLKKDFVYFSNLFKNKNKNKNYIHLNLEKKNIYKKKLKFSNVLLFNVLEHISNDQNALTEVEKLLKKKGKLFISTPFLYRYHKAPKDYKRYTLDYFEEIFQKNKKFKIIKKLSLGTGPFLASYSLLFDYLKKIPLMKYPILTLCFLLDIVLKSFHKNKNTNLYPICILIIIKKIN